MNKRKIILSVFLLFIACAEIYAQNSFSVSDRTPKYMDLNPNDYETTSKKITFEYPQWINYTTLIDSYDPASFSISVQLTSAKMPKGLELRVEASPYKGISKGEEGISTGMKSVSKGARVLIDNITTCYTGSGRGIGHRTVLSFSVPDDSKVDTTAYYVNIVYTLVQ